MTRPRKPPRGRPPLPEDVRRVRIDVRLAPATIGALDMLAVEYDVGRTAVIEALVVGVAKRPGDAKRLLGARAAGKDGA